MPLHRFAAGRLGRNVTASHMPAYASGGYPYPDNDIAALSEEIQHFVDLGFTHVKIKIGDALWTTICGASRRPPRTWSAASTWPSTR
jgi:L-alanine-DL-glutamate epimerase-like enolase superfamily enzyme